MELNAEYIKVALKCHSDPKNKCEICPYNKKCCSMALSNDALDLITSQEQKIFELENRLKECENGYEGTLFLDRCKLHDAEEKVKELTQAHEMLYESYDHLEKTKDELLADRSRLTEENERLQKLCELRDRDYKDTCELLFKAEDENENLRAQIESHRLILDKLPLEDKPCT